MRYERIVSSVLIALTLVSCADLTSVLKPVGLSVSAAELSLVLGEQKVLGAWAIDERGQIVEGSVDWQSSNPAVATIEQSGGLVTAIAVGSATMTATFGALHATTLVRVVPEPVAVALSMSTSAMTVIVGLEDALSAEATDATGRPVAEPIEWASSNPSVATAVGGIVRAVTSGETIVTATVRGLTATANVSVIDLSGSTSFARWTPIGEGIFATDVLSFLAANSELAPLEHSQFKSIAAPAWSRDGSRLAVEVIHDFWYFAGEQYTDYSSDLYVIDPAAPSETPWRALTTNGFSTAPSWSPDGNSVAFVGRRDLYSRNNIFIVRSSGGVPVRVTRTDGYYRTPRWSPDGSRLVFSSYEVRDAYYDVFVVNVDGTGLKNVSRNSGADLDPSWSPDGTQLAFVSTHQGLGHLNYELFVTDADGNSPKLLTSQREYSSGPAWSPDGKQIVFGVGAGLFVINVDGTSMARLTTPPRGSIDTSPSWRR